MTGDAANPRSELAYDHVAAWLNLSHELRTPAHAILGHVELLLGGAAGPVSGEMRAGLGDIQRAALALSAQIGQLVALTEGLPCPQSVRASDRTLGKTVGGDEKPPCGERSDPGA